MSPHGYFFSFKLIGSHQGGWRRPNSATQVYILIFFQAPGTMQQPHTPVCGIKKLHLAQKKKKSNYRNTKAAGMLPRETGGSSPGSASLAQQVSEPTSLTGRELARGTWWRGVRWGCGTKAFTRWRGSAGKGRAAAKVLGSPVRGQGGFSQRRNHTCALTDQTCRNSSPKVESGCAHRDWAAKPGLLPVFRLALTAPRAAHGQPTVDIEPPNS